MIMVSFGEMLGYNFLNLTVFCVVGMLSTQCLSY